jgi:hypothetical protein
MQVSIRLGNISPTHVCKSSSWYVDLTTNDTATQRLQHSTPVVHTAICDTTSSTMSINYVIMFVDTCVLDVR